MMRTRAVVALLFVVLTGMQTLPAAAQHIATDAAARRAMGDLAESGYAGDGGGALTLGDYATIAAIDRVFKGESDAALVARGVHKLRAEELALTFTPIAWDGLVLITHPANPVQSIGLRQLRDVYAGKIKNWRELGGADAPINLYSVAGPLDGVEFELRRALFGFGHVPVAAGRWYLNTVSLEAAVALDRHAIAVSALSNVHANKQIKMLKLEGVAPTRVAVRRGEYLLAAPVYLVERTEQAPASVARLRRVLSNESLARSLRSRKLTPIRDATMLTRVFESRREQLLAILAVPLELPLAGELLVPKEIEPRPIVAPATPIAESVDE
ncbi:MAG: substrate-binding domain-containing protein [Ahniella sp.]|nr:substrate-binding domain-containing protein [Ahniella sp.]